MIYAVFLLSTAVGAGMIFCWFFMSWLIFQTINDAWGWPGLLLLSWAISIAIFFQGTRIREWLDAI